MLRLWQNNVTKIDYTTSSRQFRGVLYEASEISVSQQINGDYTLSFKYPRNGGLAVDTYMRPNSIVDCEGQLFRIKKMTRTADPLMSFECEHVFNYDSKRMHFPNVASTDSGDFIGEDAYTVLESLSSISPFHLLTDDELSELGMERISVNIDFESMDKTNLYDVMQKIIECAGMGEIYADNYHIAIVKSIGKNSNVTLNTTLNLTDITIERDSSDMITRLYPYGKDNLEITNAEKNTDGTRYVENFILLPVRQNKSDEQIAHHY